MSSNESAPKQKTSTEVSPSRSVTDAFFVLDADWRFVYVSDEFERLLRRKRGDLIGIVAWEAFPDAVDAPVGHALRKAMQEGVPVISEEFYPSLNGWFEARAYPSFASTKLSVYFSNVSERKHGELERERLLGELAQVNAQQQSWLHQSEERFRLLVEGVKDYAIFLLDAEGYITTWNAGAERFNGYKASEIIGQHFSRFYTEADIARRHPWAELEIAAREGRYEEEGWRVRKDGTYFWTSVVITALRDDKGSLRGYAKVTRDVTDQRARERERAATQALEQQRRFLKDVLSSVTQGRLILCDDTDGLPEPPAPEAFAPPISLTKKALRAVRAQVGEAATIALLPASATQDLITAASECAMNAVQHAGGGTARVYTAAGRIQVWVEDNGTGIDLSHLPRATLESGFSTGGVGIGHGFSLMIACCCRVYLKTGSTGTIVVLEQFEQPPHPLWFHAVV